MAALKIAGFGEVMLGLLSAGTPVHTIIAATLSCARKKRAGRFPYRVVYRRAAT